MKPLVSIDDFAKLDLRIGTITNCERKEGSEKLLRLTVNFGEEEGTRNILSGIAAWYQPDELINKQFVFIINLQPRKMMGEESQGMILAAEGEKPLPLHVGQPVQSGASIR
jgi:methionine--tRNA ligase beta chain